MGIFSWIRQVLAVTRLGLQTLPRRLGPSIVAMVGIAGVVLVFVAVLSIGVGFRKTVAGSAASENAVVLRAGASSELSSGLSLEETRRIAEAPGIARGSGGPLASAEIFVIIDLDKRSTGTEANVPLRGVEPEAFEVRKNFQIVEGRNFEPGRQEIIVGVGALREFAGTDVGSTLRLGQADWRVVGAFSTGGSVAESELWADTKVLGPAYSRGTNVQSVYARLTSPEAFDPFKDALTTDPQLNVRVMREEEYYADQAQALDILTKVVGGGIALIMGLGAIFGAVLTLYSAVVTRGREIATLRALGFRGGPVVVSVMVEALLLGLIGGAVGGGLAYVLFNGFRAATLNFQSFSQVTFAFAVTPGLITAGIAGALFMGLIGGLLPALRAARLPVAEALREG